MSERDTFVSLASAKNLEAEAGVAVVVPWSNWFSFVDEGSGLTRKKVGHLCVGWTQLFDGMQLWMRVGALTSRMRVMCASGRDESLCGQRHCVASEGRTRPRETRKASVMRLMEEG